MAHLQMLLWATTTQTQLRQVLLPEVLISCNSGNFKAIQRCKHIAHLQVLLWAAATRLQLRQMLLPEL
jgi:hypothetical protein